MINYKNLGVINTRQMLSKALAGGYAVPGFNFSHLEQAQAIIQAIVETRSPLILQILKSDREYIGAKLVPNIVQGLVKYAMDLGLESPQIAMHLDHGDSFELCKNCIDDGFSSVMIDGSHLPFEKNIELTQKVTEYAHKYDVTVEGELGVIAGAEGYLNSKLSLYTEPDDVIDFVRRTGCDSLAISIGTAHGSFKFTAEQCVKNENGILEPPPLAFSVLEEIEKKLTGFPIVLHGSSTVPQEKVKLINKYGGKLNDAVGIPENQLKKASKQAVCKINIDSDSRLTMTATLREFFEQKPQEYDPRLYLAKAREDMKAVYIHLIKDVLGSANKL
ncbi:ketose-bisphosphate aldolase [Apibacter sp. HY039]|uniref:ketose-bisphosphate aldolase n=1 Tax=Apibacter sp. HY039 TaxID=2501476 RepID=UPI000FEBE48F|nr:ketose-bisphosphate aldolase [Apibacter sp. HY039]